MHTAPESCTQVLQLYVCNLAVRVLLWHMSHPVSVWGNPPALKKFSTWGRQCRESMDKTLAWAQVKGNCKCRRIGRGLEALKEMKDVSHKLVPVGAGAKGVFPLLPSRPTWCPLWYFTASRILILAVLSLGRVR